MLLLLYDIYIYGPPDIYLTAASLREALKRSYSKKETVIDDMGR
jgi:hypothetical protein